MFGANPANGSSRRLPQWMLGVSSAGQVKKCDNAKENVEPVEEGPASLPCSSNVETGVAHPRKRTRLQEKETFGGGSCVLVKCEAKKRKRKSNEQDEDIEGNAMETVEEKKGGGRGRRKVQEPVAPDRQKEKALGKGVPLHEKKPLEDNPHTLVKCGMKRTKTEYNELDAERDSNVSETFPENIAVGRLKVQEPAALERQEARESSCVDGEERDTPSDDDFVLTAEDLMTIAEEYIQANRNVKQEEASNLECKSSSRFAESVSCGKKFGDPRDAQNCNQGSRNQDASTDKPNGSSANEEIACNSSGTGDPAQDMLNLFLGPWLTKPVEKGTRANILTEKKEYSYEIETQQTHSNVVREDIAPIMKKKSSLKGTRTDILTDNKEFSCEIETQTRSNVVREDIAPIMKKKSSLKDKVAMFLD